VIEGAAAAAATAAWPRVCMFSSLSEPSPSLLPSSEVPPSSALNTCEQHFDIIIEHMLINDGYHCYDK
jgi:hypothetical protein